MNKKWPVCEICIPHFLLVVFNKLSVNDYSLTYWREAFAAASQRHLFPLCKLTPIQGGEGEAFFSPSWKYFKVPKAFTPSPTHLSPWLTSALWQRDWHRWPGMLDEELDWTRWQLLVLHDTTAVLQDVSHPCFLIRDLYPGEDSCCDCHYDNLENQVLFPAEVDG